MSLTYTNRPSIRAKLLLNFLIITLIPLLVLTFAATYLTNSLIEDKISELIQLETRQILDSLDKNRQELLMFPSKIRIKQTQKLLIKDNTTSQTLRSLLDNHHLFFIALLNKQKEVIYTEVIPKTPLEKFQGMPLPLTTSPSDLKNKFLLSHHTRYFREFTLPTDFKNFGVSFNPSEDISHGIMMEFISVPLYNNSTIPLNTNVIGYMIAGKRLDLNQIIESHSNDPNRFIGIKFNNVIAHANSAIADKVFRKALTKTPVENIFIHQEVMHHNNIYRVFTLDISTGLSSNHPEFIVAVNITDYIFLKEKIRNLIIQVSLLVGFGGLLMALIFANSITKPIGKLVNAINNIKKGKFDIFIQSDDTVELGQLCNTFNEMTTELQNRNNQINNYNKILENQKNRFESIIKFSHDSIVALDDCYSITGFNPAFINLAGESENSLLGKKIWDVINFGLYNFYKEVEGLLNIEDLPKYLQEGRIKNIAIDISYSEIKNTDKNGKDTTAGYVLILRDVTKRKEVDELKENFVATLTHDLRVPLLASVNTLNYLNKGSYGNLSEDQRYVVEQLIGSNQELLTMVNNILDTYKYEAGQQTLIHRKVNLNKLLKEVIEDLSSLIKEKEHHLTVNIPEEHLYVLADRVEIKRVIMNLLSNAITYTGQKGNLQVLLEFDQETTSVKIIDNGPGLTENELTNIFKRYARGMKTLRKIGSGLGLYLSKQIIDSHDGHIFAESKVNQGSCFGFTLNIAHNSEETYEP